MGMTAIKVGDRLRDKNLIGSPAIVTAVDPDGAWVEARWIPGAPAYRYGTHYALRMLVTDKA